MINHVDNQFIYVNIVLILMVGGRTMAVPVMEERMREYHKIETVFERSKDGDKRLVVGKFRSQSVEYLATAKWIFTEKVDGTNIRVHWDGHKITFGGRTDNAQIPVRLLNRLQEIFLNNETEELFEQEFGEKEVILFGEGYGDKIQEVGKKYLADSNDFILFDALINNTYLARNNLEKLAQTFNLKIVPIVVTGTINDGIEYVKSAPQSLLGSCRMEGIIGTPEVPLYDKKGRIIVKIKYCDFGGKNENATGNFG